MRPSDFLFLKTSRLLVLALLVLVPAGAAAQPQAADTSFLKDRATISVWLTEGAEHHRKGADAGQLLEYYGRKQFGIPYVGFLLEQPATETLVITLEGSDCVLFVEHSLALTVTTLQGSVSYDDFARNLAFFRYYEGRADGYTSRQHYFSDWLLSNQEKNLITLLAQDPSLPALRPVHFMTSNRALYPKLAASDDVARFIAGREQVLNRTPLRYIPQQHIRAYESQFKTGDILGFVSTIDGLDIAHTALIVREGDRVGFYHASTTGAVMKDPKTVFEYTRDRGNVDGIIVARLGENVDL